MEPIIGGGQRPPQQPGIRITNEQLANAETIKCPKCGGITFRPSIVFKKIPAVMVGEGAGYKLLPFNQGIFVCEKCGELAPWLKDDPALSKLLGLNEDE